MTGKYAPDIGLPARTRFREEMIRDLRNELIHLKSSRITILTFGITGSGVFLGRGESFARHRSMHGECF